MNVFHLRVNHLKNPLGYDLGIPYFSWKTESDLSQKQAAAQLIIAVDPDFSEICFDSGKADLDSLGTKAAFRMEWGHRYYWKVQVWGDRGDTAVSETAWFELGVSKEGPGGTQWITADFGKQHPLFRKTFDVCGELSRARLYVYGLGLYEAYLNGKKVGDEYLTPYCNDYDSWQQVQTYDITGMIKQGKNALGVMLGNGWYKGRIGYDNWENPLYGEEFVLYSITELSYADGRKEWIRTDESWLTAPGPVMDSGIYDGEIYDANQEIPRWAEADCDYPDWQPAKLFGKRFLGLSDRLSPPVLVHERLKPVEVIHTPAGETVLDFGQNMTGWVEVQLDLPKGKELRLQYGEILQNDCFYRDNLRTAQAEYTYRSNGTPALVRPHFTFYGFRYVKVEGVENVCPADFTACVLHSQLKQIGRIETSNPKINRLYLNTVWGQKGNFLDVPTDCPQRDERLGWTGDTQIFSGTGCFHMDSAAFYHKFMVDTMKEQGKFGGSVPYVVPQMIRSDGFPVPAGSCAWSDVATIVPWNCYLHYGNKGMLEKQYRCMRDWVDYIYEQDEADGGRRLWQTGFHLADWLALNSPTGDYDDRLGGTDMHYVASAYYYYSTSLTAKAAKVLNRPEAGWHETLANEIKAAFQKEYFTPDGMLKVQTQTAHAVALYMGLVPDELKNKVTDQLKLLLDKKGCHLDTGFVGTPYLCPSLSQNSANDYAYTLLLNEDYPSWLYEVNLGATTIWERWNSVLEDGSISDTGMNSLNHYAYGSIAEWMYRYMCGINPCEDKAGFARVRLAPLPDPRLQYAKASLDTPKGLLESGWEYHEDGSVCYRFKVPFDAEAILELPKGTTLNGQDVSYPVVVPTGTYIAVTPSK